MNTVECQDCEGLMPDNPLPAVDDDEAWEREATYHELHCYALLTRGRQRPNPCAHVPGVWYMGRRRWLALEIPRRGA